MPARLGRSIMAARLDGTKPLNSEERALLAAVEGRPAVVVLNKCDLASAATSNMAAPEAESKATPPLKTSALTGEGIAPLRDRILALATGGAAAEPGLLTTVRHQQAIATTRAALADAAQANTNNIPHEMILIDLYRALWALDSLTGQTTSDDILNLIFSTFCIGK